MAVSSPTSSLHNAEICHLRGLCGEQGIDQPCCRPNTDRRGSPRSTQLSRLMWERCRQTQQLPGVSPLPDMQPLGHPNHSPWSRWLQPAPVTLRREEVAALAASPLTPCRGLLPPCAQGLSVSLSALLPVLCAGTPSC